jgi:hypothetical protein
MRWLALHTPHAELNWPCLVVYAPRVGRALRVGEVCFLMPVLGKFVFDASLLFVAPFFSLMTWP